MGYVIDAIALTKYFGASKIFEDISLSLLKGEKAALIGDNGVGKTTLMKCLMQEESLDSGQILLEKGTTIGFLEQIPDFDDKITLMEAVLGVFEDLLDMRDKIREMEKQMPLFEGDQLEVLLRKYGNIREQYERSGGFSCESKTRKILSGLGFREEDHHRLASSFSGGEKTRISLARLLVKEYDVLFLDEPTNHLDLASIEWLEAYLKTSNATMLVVSHDRFFLNEICQSVFHLTSRGMRRYKGNYDAFVIKKEQEEEAHRRAFLKQQAHIEETEAYIDRYRAGIKSKQARGRLSQLNRLERLDAPKKENSLVMEGRHHVSRSGDKVLYIDQVGFAHDEDALFENIEETVLYQEKIALLGPNGMGKTTLLKLILGELKPQKGQIRYGSRVKPAYFDQEHGVLVSNETVLESLILHHDLTPAEAKNLLASYQFYEEDWTKKTEVLSGGEQGRLALLKLTLEKGNFLILDEPTNHLDIQTREAMENYLQKFPGTVLMVSHDRFFVDALATRIWELKDKKLTSFPGNYSDYKEKIRVLDAEAVEADDKQTRKKKIHEKNQDRVVRAQLRKTAQEIETSISESESRLKEITDTLSDPHFYQSSDSELLKALTLEMEKLELNLSSLYETWEETLMSLENL